MRKTALLFSALLWPTNASDCLTSSFGEFREAHFHSGIDISTNGTTGYPCYAVGKGDIARIRMSCRGYGKCVYLRLEDGKTAVYAHLSEFAGALADTVQAIQQSRGTVLFDREFPKGALPVERGDLIARTGQSGAGPPHLHFEIRDEQERALDPLAYGIAAPDRTPPRITRIALTPLTPESLVDGDSRTVIVDVDHENGAAVADRIVPVAGRIGIAMEARDSIDACERRLAPKRWELREGTTTLFAVNVDRFTFDEWDLVDLHFDPRYSYSNRGNFMNLWKRTGNDFPAVVGNWPAADGVAGNGAAQRALTLAVVDAAGNRSEASLILDFAAGAVKSTPPNPPGDAGRLPELENHGAWIEARFPRNAAPALPSWMAAGWKPVAEGSTPRHVVTAAEFSSSQVPVRSTLVHANAEGRITSSDSFIEVRFPAGTLREDTIVLLRETPLPSHSKELEPAGSLYKIDTGIVPLAGSYKIEARPPSSFSGRRELLALYVHTGGYFRYIGGAEGKELFSGSTQWPTAFGLFEDSKPPTFGQGRIVRRGRERRIELRVRDGGAGLECDDIQVLVNGRRLLHEYDSETTLVSAILTSAPSAGSSIQVRIDATDRVGNSASSTQTLRARK